MRKVIILLPLLLLAMSANAQSVVDSKGSKRVADTTNDSWKNDVTNTQVTLSYQSDNSTARTAGTEVVIKDDGKVGIGTTAPSFLLDVQGASAIAHFKRMNNSATNAAAFLFARARGTSTAQTDIVAGDYLGKVQFRGHVGAADLDFATLSYIANSTTAGDGHFAFFKGTGGAELMTINTSSANVGIGTGAPQKRLHVNGALQITNELNVGGDSTTAGSAGTSGQVLISGGANAAPSWSAVSNIADATNDAWVNDLANNMVKLGTQSNGSSARIAGTEVVIKDDGSVGIGTATPGAKLNVVSGGFRLENENNWNAYTGVTYSNTQYPQLFLYQARGTKAAPTYPASGTTMGVFRSADAIDSMGGAGFRIRSTQQQSLTAHGSSMIIFTTPNGQSANVDQFIVDQNGYTGIGTLTPTARLSVLDTGTANYFQIADFLAPNNKFATNEKNTLIKFGVTATTRNSSELRFTHIADGSTSNRLDLGFSGLVAPPVSILASGSVGIGTTAPAATLDINGNERIATVDNIGADTTYKPLVWNTSTRMVQTSVNYSHINKSVTVAAAGTGSVYTLAGAAAYEVKIFVETGCNGTFYNKFAVTGGNANSNWVIGYMGGMSQNGDPTKAGTSTKTSVVMLNPYLGGCSSDNTTSFNYTISVVAGTGELTITNNGSVSRTYRVVIEKVVD